MSNRPEDPDKLSNEEYKKAFGRPSPLEKAMNRQEQDDSPNKKKKRDPQARTYTNEEVVEMIQEMEKDEQEELRALMEQLEGK